MSVRSNIMGLRPIKTEEDYRAAMAEIERLWDAKPGSDDEDRVDILTTLVESYESRTRPVLPPDPVEALRYYMDSRGITRKELQQYLGSRGRITEILNRRRGLSIEMIRSLHTSLNIPADLLIQPYPLVPATRRAKPKHNGAV